MFEKEAEEYLKTDGTKAEFILDMLNKTHPLEITVQQAPYILAVLEQVYKDGAEFGYNKANEWHDLRKNPQDLPKREGTFLVAIKYPAGWCESFILEYTTDEDNEEKLGWWDSEYTNFDNEVYAWREIPKPPKGE